MKCGSTLVSVSGWSKGSWLGVLAARLEREFGSTGSRLPSMGAGLRSQSRAAQSHPPGAPPELMSPDRGGEGGASLLLVTLGSKMCCLQEMHPAAFCLGSGSFPGCWGSRMLE